MSPRLIIFVLLLVSASAFAAARQDQGAILDAVKNFLRHEISGFPGTVELEINAADMRLSLPACAQLQAFIPDGARLTGNTSVGVRCLGESPWTIVLPVRIQVTGYYLAAAHQIERGRTLRQDDLVVKEGDLTQLPQGILSLPAQAIGKVMTISVATGDALHQGIVYMPETLQSRQQSRTVAREEGFVAVGKGWALSSADDWQAAVSSLSGRDSGQRPEGPAKWRAISFKP